MIIESESKKQYERIAHLCEDEEQLKYIALNALDVRILAIKADLERALKATNEEISYSNVFEHNYEINKYLLLEQLDFIQYIREEMGLE